jgi:hypothetical protein
MKIEFTIPLTKNLIVSEGNRSWEHWSKKSKRHKSQHFLIECFMNQQPDVILPCLITLTRISPRMLDEDDNLPYSFKWYKDALADYIIPGKASGRADDDKRLHWRYKQEKGKVREYALKVEIENV